MKLRWDSFLEEIFLLGDLSVEQPKSVRSTESLSVRDVTDFINLFLIDI